MQLRSIIAKRQGDYDYGKVDYSKPLIMTVTIGDDKSESKIELDEAACARVLSVLSEELAAQARRVAEAMVAKTFESTYVAIEAPKADEVEDEIPF